MSSSGYIGSPSIETSTANQEIIPQNYSFHKFSFINYQTCTVKINDSLPIYLAEGQGFGCDVNDTRIKSFVIIESGIQYNWVGAYKYVSIFK